MILRRALNRNNKSFRIRRPVLLLFAVSIQVFLAAPPSGAFHLVKKWATERVFKVPESVCWDFDREILYVSNIAGDPARLLDRLSKTAGRQVEFPFLPLAASRRERDQP